MNIRLVFLTLAAVAQTASGAPFQEATVTRVVNKVDLLHADRKPQRAEVGAEVRGGTAVRTGADSRTELRFPDQSITRLGANALFRFETGTRSMELDHGTILFSPAKKTGGGEVRLGAVTAAVAGTTFLASHVPDHEIKIIVVEGKVKVYWKGFLLGARVLRPGEMFFLPLDKPNARCTITVLDLKKLIATSRLLESGEFEALPNWPEVLAAAGHQKIPVLKIRGDSPARGTMEAQGARRIEDVNRPPHPVAPPAPRPHNAAPPPVAPQPPPLQPGPTPRSTPPLSTPPPLGN